MPLPRAFASRFASTLPRSTRNNTHTHTDMHTSTQTHTLIITPNTTRSVNRCRRRRQRGYFMTGFLLHLPHLRLSACHILLYRCIFHFSQLSSAPAATLTTPKTRALLNARDPIALYQSWGRARILHLPHSHWIARLLSSQHPQTANSSRHPPPSHARALVHSRR